MQKINISGMDVEGLLDLRDEIDARLGKHRHNLEKQLERLGPRSKKVVRLPSRRKSFGRKVAPKYQSRKNPKLKWSGRGVTPIWMREEIKGTKLKREDFRIK